VIVDYQCAIAGAWRTDFTDWNPLPLLISGNKSLSAFQVKLKLRYHWANWSLLWNW